MESKLGKMQKLVTIVCLLHLGAILAAGEYKIFTKIIMSGIKVCTTNYILLNWLGDMYCKDDTSLAHL